MEEVLDNLSDNGGNLKVTESIKTSLKSACEWAKVISIIQIVFLGLGMVLLSCGNNNQGNESDDKNYDDHIIESEAIEKCIGVFKSISDNDYRAFCSYLLDQKIPLHKEIKGVSKSNDDSRKSIFDSVTERYQKAQEKTLQNIELTHLLVEKIGEINIVYFFCYNDDIICHWDRMLCFEYDDKHYLEIQDDDFKSDTRKDSDIMDSEEYGELVIAGHKYTNSMSGRADQNILYEWIKL